MTAAELITELQGVAPETRVILAIGDARAMCEEVKSGALPLAVGKDSQPLYGIRAVILFGSSIDFNQESRVFGHHK